jgi:GAF domain-containing protein
MYVDRAKLEDSLRRLDQLGAAQFDSAQLVDEVINAARQFLPVTGLGLMVVDGGNALRHIAASDDSAQVLEDAQEHTGEGPCVAAFVLGHPVWSTDLRADTRWPRLRGQIGQARLRAVLGVPLRLGGMPIGTINAYQDHPTEWPPDAVATLVRFGTVMENLLAASVGLRRGDALAAQLQYALDYRVAIERAIGYLMASENIDGVTAFNRLRAAARSSRRRIGEVAEDTLRGTPPAG